MEPKVNDSTISADAGRGSWFIDALGAALEKKNCRILKNTPVETLEYANNKWLINGQESDTVISMVQPQILKKLLKEDMLNDICHRFKIDISEISYAGMYIERLAGPFLTTGYRANIPPVKIGPTFYSASMFTRNCGRMD